MMARLPRGWFAFCAGLVFLLFVGPSIQSCAADVAPIQFTVVAPSIIFPDDSPKIGTGAADRRLSWITIRSQALGGKSRDLTTVQVYLNERKVSITPYVSIEAFRQVPAADLRPDTVYGVLKDAELDLALPWAPVGWSWPDYHGKVRVRLVVDGQMSETREVMISVIAWRFWPVAFSTALSLIILGVPILLIWLRQRSYTVADREFSVLGAMFLDRETDTYSLSKFQFYVWTAAAVFGYLVLTLARSFVQGQFVFSDVPTGLPGLIFISGGTTIVAQGINAAKGPKGAGGIYPSLADFVSSGGLIAVERFQFFVWTIVGVLTFLFLIIFDNPANVTDLPAVPAGFLALMGVSSFGYIGGKLARKPGPIIDEIGSAMDGEVLALMVRGRKLSKDASLQIDGRTIAATDLRLTALDADDVDEKVHAQLFKTLEIRVAKPLPAQLTGGKHTLKLINSDSQEAEWYYVWPANPEVKTITARTGNNNNVLILTIDGAQLAGDAAFTINEHTITAAHEFKVTGENPDPAFPQDAAPSIYQRLTLEIKKPRPEWVTISAHGGAPIIHRLVVHNGSERKSLPTAFQLPSAPPPAE